MEFSVQRKPVVKYGKNKNRVVGVNFFDDNPKPAGTTIALATKKYPISPSSAGEQSNKEDAQKPNPTPYSPSPSPSPVMKPAHVTTHSISSPSKSRSISPVKPPATVLGTSDAATFEIISSDDDEPEMAAQRPLKKRKLTQTLKQQRARPAEPRIELNKPAVEHKVQRQALKKKQENSLGPRSEDKQGLEPQKEKAENAGVSKPGKVDLAPVDTTTLPVKPNKPVSQPRTQKSQVAAKPDIAKKATAIVKGQIVSKAKPAETSPSGRVKSRTKLKKVSGRGNLSQNLAVSADTESANDVDMNDSESQPPQKKRSYVKTKSGPEETPKRRRQFSPARSETSAASPGSRLFSELRLSPSKSPVPETYRHISQSPIQNPVRRGRIRRIDRLDAPAEQPSLPSTRAPSLQRSDLSTGLVQHNPSDVEAEESIVGRPALTRSNSSQTKLAYGKARNTYGKERSYLADMVDDLEALSYDSSQEASHRLASQLAASSGPSQLQMELDLDSSSSEDGVVSLKLKSIHELRQAGSNDRFSRDLEGLLLDIDPTAAGASKSLRIQACIKLFTKLSQESFATFILDQGLDRLIEWSKKIGDKISQLLLSMVFWRLIHVKGASPVRVRSILQAVATSTGLITDFGTFSGLVKDRKQNLDKHTIRDLIKFENQILASKSLPGYDAEDIVPAAVVLAALHDALQKLIQAGLSNVSMGNQSIKKIVSILMQVSQQSQNKTVQDRFITKVALSLLKLFSGPLESDLGLNAGECVTLGDTLGSIIGNALEGGHEDLLQAVLHFAVSLCNDKPTICRNINKSAFVGRVLTLAHDRFMSLVKTADRGNDIDAAMLDSIILSLASLLNITEYDDTVRLELAHQKAGSSPSTHLMTLIEIYVKAAPQADTAMTAEKVQLQVAFGWLSLLICNLCLEDTIWTETQHLLSRSKMALSDVVASAKELLIHLQTVEMGQRQVSEDESTVALDGFTLRFGAILAAVKIA